MLGYDGHIHMLIGMDTSARLTGVIMDMNNEPYGEFSIDLPPFAAQFKGKSIRDPFAYGRDVDAISRATISVRSAALTIRESARIVAAADCQSSFSATALGVTFIFGSYSATSTTRPSPTNLARSSARHESQGP